MEHLLKTNSDLFQKIVEGSKKFELRLGVRDIHEGDILVLKEIDKNTKEPTGRVLRKDATFVLRTKDVDFWPKSDVDNYGFVVVGFN